MCNGELSLTGMPTMLEQPKAHKVMVDRQSNSSMYLILPFLKGMEEVEAMGMEMFDLERVE